MTIPSERIRAALAMGPTPGPWLFCPTNSGVFVKSELPLFVRDWAKEPSHEGR